MSARSAERLDVSTSDLNCVFHILIVFSDDAEASRLPSIEKAKQLTEPECPSSERNSDADCIFHNFTVISLDADASC
jgi:hypothetical protein